MRKLAGTLLLFSVLPGTLPAQGTFGPVSLSVGAGIEASHVRDNTEWTPGRTLHAALHFQPATARWGVRVAGWFYDRSLANGQFASRSQAAGLGIDATLDLSGGGTRPYLFAGGGTSWLFTSLTTAPAPLRDGGSAFVSGGIGLRHRVGPASLFGELRAIHPLNGQGFGEVLAPLVLGVRF